MPNKAEKMLKTGGNFDLIGINGLKLKRLISLSIKTITLKGVMQ